jgi:hypothetical protein
MSLRYKGFRRPDLRADAGVKVAQWVRDHLGDDLGFAVGVSGSECGHAACAGNDTIILLMRPGEPPVRIKIAKPIEMVRQAEIADVLRSVLAELSSAVSRDLNRAQSGGA